MIFAGLFLVSFSICEFAKLNFLSNKRVVWLIVLSDFAPLHAQSPPLCEFYLLILQLLQPIHVLFHPSRLFCIPFSFIPTSTAFI